MSTLLPRLFRTATHLSSRTLAFVGGQGKSGTTWVEKLIDAHPQAACLGEGHFAEGLGRVLYQALDAYNGLITSNNQRFHELEDFPTFSADDAAELVRAALLMQFSRIAERNREAQVIAVRTPSELNWLRELNDAFPTARFVHVLRDPRDVAMSMWWHSERLEPGRMARDNETPGGLALKLVPRWAQHVAHVRDTAVQIGAHLLEVRYEDLHGESQRTVQALFEFLGLDADPVLCKSCVERASFSRLSGRDVGQIDVNSHFRTGTTNQWQGTIPAGPAQGWPREVAMVLKSLGYSID